MESTLSYPKYIFLTNLQTINELPQNYFHLRQGSILQPLHTQTDTFLPRSRRAEWAVKHPPARTLLSPPPFGDPSCAPSDHIKYTLPPLVIKLAAEYADANKSASSLGQWTTPCINSCMAPEQEKLSTFLPGCGQRGSVTVP